MPVPIRLSSRVCKITKKREFSKFLSLLNLLISFKIAMRDTNCLLFLEIPTRIVEEKTLTLLRDK